MRRGIMVLAVLAGAGLLGGGLALLLAGARDAQVLATGLRPAGNVSTDLACDPIVAAPEASIGARSEVPAQAEAERELLVVDSAGLPVAGVEIAPGGRVFDADGRRRGEPGLGVTGADGRARLRVADLPRKVSLCAAGFEILEIDVPDAAEAWIVTLPRSHRIELVLHGAGDMRGLHAEVELSEAFVERRFWEMPYTQTPGRCVAGSSSRWSGGSRGSTWSLGFDETGCATLDQLADAGPLRVRLMRFEEELERRECELRAGGGTLRLEFAMPVLPPGVRGTITDVAGRPLAGVQVQMLARRGRVTLGSGLPLAEPLPRWAPCTQTDGNGLFELPRPADETERVFLHLDGCADRVLDVAQIDAREGRIVLGPGRVVRLEFVGRDGEALDGGWETIGHYFAEPRACLGLDVWRAASRDGHPAAAGQPCVLPFFLFADLPAGEVVFGCDVLADEVLVHDTRSARARFVASKVVDELGLGK